MMFNATLRQLEVIGEASNRLSEKLILNNPEIPWARIIGLRNLVIHEYFGIDDLTIWNVIKINLHDLKVKVAAILEKMSFKYPQNGLVWQREFYKWLKETL